MQSAVTPERLFTLCSELKQKGAKGCLVSGGCLPDGSVPLKQFASAIGRIKRELALTVFVHTGIVDLEAAVLFKEAGVDAALIDVIGSQETIDKVYHLNVKVKDYADSLLVLQNAGLPFVPHVIVGLNNGKLDGELKALQTISADQALSGCNYRVYANSRNRNGASYATTTLRHRPSRRLSTFDVSPNASGSWMHAPQGQLACCHRCLCVESRGGCGGVSK